MSPRQQLCQCCPYVIREHSDHGLVVLMYGSWRGCTSHSTSTLAHFKPWLVGTADARSSTHYFFTWYGINYPPTTYMFNTAIWIRFEFELCIVQRIFYATDSTIHIHNPWHCGKHIRVSHIPVAIIALVRKSVLETWYLSWWVLQHMSRRDASRLTEESTGGGTMLMLRQYTSMPDLAPGSRAFVIAFQESTTTPEPL